MSGGFSLGTAEETPEISGLFLLAGFIRARPGGVFLSCPGRIFVQMSHPRDKDMRRGRSGGGPVFSFQSTLPVRI